MYRSCLVGSTFEFDVVRWVQGDPSLGVPVVKQNDKQLSARRGRRCGGLARQPFSP
jgi:hypothetical protein